MVQPSLYSTPPDADRSDDLLAAYEAHLAERNGNLWTPDGFERRNQDMAELDASSRSQRIHRHIDADRFNALYTGFRASPDLDEDLLSLLAFVKVNAAEAYGVEVTTAARAKRLDPNNPLMRLEHVLAREETYHTRLLCGVTDHVDGLTVEGAWTPPTSVKVLIHVLAYAPGWLFHPILLGSEIAGVFLFNWMLKRCQSLFPNDPAMRESMERRLIEVLVDEIGHIAFNRIAVGPVGVRVARPLAAAVNRGVSQQHPEFQLLGMDANTHRELADFDLHSLPEEVRRRAFFV